MAAKKSYNRFFIIFQEEDKGYGMGPDRPPTGYAKVETRNDKSKVTVYVQNLKPFESGDFLYKCYLISHHDNKDNTAYLGMINIDDLGRGESSWETSADSAFDTKVSIDKFNGAAVVVENEGLPGIIAPLAGYMSKEKFDWRNGIAELKKPNKPAKVGIADADKPVVEEEKAFEAAKFEQYENSIEEAKHEEVKSDTEPEVITAGGDIAEAETIAEPEITAEPILSDKQQDISAEDIYASTFAEAGEMNGIQDYDVNDYHTSEEEDNERSKHNEHKEHKEYKPCYQSCTGCSGHPGHLGYSYRRMLKKMLEDILEDYEKVSCKELKDCIMWKVDMAKCTRDGYKMTMYPCYDLVFYPMMYNPYWDYSKHIRKHGHYIFGMKHDKDGKITALIYGIPGRKVLGEQPVSGITGFTKWIPSNDKHGYWIMMYDPMTGIISTDR